MHPANSKWQKSPFYLCQASISKALLTALMCHVSQLLIQRSLKHLSKSYNMFSAIKKSSYNFNYQN